METKDKKIRTILIIEDEPDISELMRIFLEQYDYEVLAATTPTDGLSLAKKHKISAIFLDIKLPEMNGFDVLKKLKTLCPHVPVLMMTGLPLSKWKERALFLGAHKFIEKPFSLENIFNHLKEIFLDVDDVPEVA